MAADFLPMLFQPYKQARLSTVREHGGERSSLKCVCLSAVVTLTCCCFPLCDLDRVAWQARVWDWPSADASCRSWEETCRSSFLPPPACDPSTWYFGAQVSSTLGKGSAFTVTLPMMHGDSER